MPKFPDLSDHHIIHDAIERMDRPNLARSPDLSLAGSEEKLAWAYENIERSEQILDAFLASQPTTIIQRIDNQTGNKHFQLKYVRPFPREIARYTGYALYDLRSALEHVAVTAARKYGCVDLRHVNFPFASSERNLREILFIGRGKREALQKFIGTEFAKFIADEKPYKGGNDFLWDLGRISNHDRHVEVIPISALASVSAFRNISAFGGPDGRDRPGTAGLVFDNPGNLEHGITVSIGGPDAMFILHDEDEPNIDIPTEIQFRNTETFDGQPVFETLHRAHKLVTDIIDRARIVLNLPATARGN